MHKVSVWSSMFVEKSPEDVVSIMARHGYNYTELSDEHGTALLDRGSPSAAGKVLLSHAKSLGLSFPQGHLLLNADIVNPDQCLREKTIEPLKKFLELFHALEIQAAVLHPGGRAAAKAGWTEEKITDLRIESLNSLCSFAGNGPLICLENIYHNHRSFFDMFDALPQKNLGICLDTGHLNLCGGNWGDFIRKAGSRLKALHIADNMGLHDDHLLPYGFGTVNWTEVMSALSEVGCTALFNYEIPGEQRCPDAVREAKLDYALKLASIMEV